MVDGEVGGSVLGGEGEGEGGTDAVAGVGGGEEAWWWWLLLLLLEGGATCQIPE